MSFCSNCGGAIKEQMKFCPFCGAKIQTIIVGQTAGYYPPATPQGERKKRLSNPYSNRNASNNMDRGVQPRQISNAVGSGNNPNVGNRTAPNNGAIPTNCPNCGAPIDSFSSHCRSCGTELTHKIQASACKELCNRLDQIEASRPKETLLSFVAGLANAALDRNKLAPTDQQKIELISNFVVPNTKADIMEFLFLCRTRIKACLTFSSDTDEYVARVQKELLHVWRYKFEQTLEKAKLVLSDDPDFRAYFTQYQREKYRNENVCQYCGGKFKGLVHKSCSKCGKPKDY